MAHRDSTPGRWPPAAARRMRAVLAATLFAVAFLAVYVQLASGHDPALVANAARRSLSSAVATATSSSSSAGAGAGAESSATESAGESSDEGASAGETGVSAVTTSQS